ncbi:MAG: hypothetical protein CMM77_07070 [Rhodospirillaceae bacterium]|nr:hypothetical protein [Magnetovibrio sp.]MAY66872.1 hypothetical protein [Rhodospirillaceae bacterium]|tara:strand:+ start:249 stop:632 length:384 start_codon:yes stop_codon:yes gene_type:complete
MKSIFAALLGLLLFAPMASADDYMSADDVTALFTNKTFDGIYLPKDKTFKAFEAADGTHNVVYPNGKKSKGRKWFVNDQGQHCTTHKKKKEPRCSFIKDAGNGVYHKINNAGAHTHTMRNFRDGNQL